MDHWEEHWADTRIHGTTNGKWRRCSPRRNPSYSRCRWSRFVTTSTATNGSSGWLCRGGAAYYGAPPGWIRRKVRVQWDGLFVRLLDPRTGQLLREHLRQKRGAHRIRDEDRPRRTPLRIQQLLTRAHKAGANIGALCDAIHHRQRELGTRRIQGVFSLVKKYGCAATDEACAPALELTRPSTASSAAVWSALRKHRSVCAKSIP